MKRIFLLAAMFALPATVAMAAIDTEGLISGYQAEGYTSIEVTRGLNQTKVEAIRANEKIEVIYDNTTGQPLKSEVGTPEADDDIQPGVTVRDRNGNFVDVGSMDDDEDDSSDDDSDDDGDDSGDDDSGDDDSDDGDDNGGDDNDDGDDNGGDDNDGGDDNGGDNDGGDED